MAQLKLNPFPMCWKCSACTTRPADTGINGVKAREIVGCELSTTIKSYEDAEKSCPVVKPSQLTGKLAQ